jgi:hypothetical protein
MNCKKCARKRFGFTEIISQEIDWTEREREREREQ